MFFVVRKFGNTSKLHKTIEKKKIVSEIIVSELVTLSLSVKKRILVIGRQCVKKQS